MKLQTNLSLHPLVKRWAMQNLPTTENPNLSEFLEKAIIKEMDKRGFLGDKYVRA